MRDLTAERVRELLNYDPKTGAFYHNFSHGPVQAGQLAGSINGTGYNQISVDGVIYRSARLAWLYVTGSWPKNEVDHINRNSLDDSFVNLREATAQQNCFNKGVQRNNSSGFKGVRFRTDAQKWTAAIRIGGTKHHLGYFTTAKEAGAAYALAAMAVHGEFFHDGSAP